LPEKALLSELRILTINAEPRFIGMPSLIKLPSECRVLIIDDEVSVCDFLARALETRYVVATATTGTQGLALMGQTDFDVIVTDLRLPDISGLDVLSNAKSKDPYTEVILITGFASMESASIAINSGAASYIEKPMSLPDFLVQIEKAVASRLFHLRSISLMRKSDDLAPEFRDHLSDITSLYYFTRKLTLSLEISEIMRITLEEALRKSGAVFSAIGVNALGFQEIYTMSASGEAEGEKIRSLLERHWDTTFPFINKERFLEGKVTTVMYKGMIGESKTLDGLRPLAVPMMVAGASIGALVVFLDEKVNSSSANQPFLHIISSLISSLVEHGYSELQAKALAKTDGLTGIANHRSFHEALDRELSRANRKESSFGLIILDIDDFKRINDTYGHLVGDAVLKDLVRRISEKIRISDVLARYGGEEFSLILPETDRTGAEVLAERVRKAFTEKPFAYAQHSIFYTVSIGLTIYNARTPVKKDLLIDQADAAMYEAKHGGKNRVAVSTACL
jgi:diguanylate cyclase (GGDEF)-like protein